MKKSIINQPASQCFKMTGPFNTRIEAKGNDAIAIAKNGMKEFQALTLKNALIYAGTMLVAWGAKKCISKAWSSCKSKWKELQTEVKSTTGSELLRKQTNTSITWMFINLVAVGGIAFLYGYPKVGKTTFLLNLLLSANGGKQTESLPAANNLMSKLHAIYYNMEMTDKELGEMFGQNPLFDSDIRLVNQIGWDSMDSLLDHIEKELNNYTGDQAVGIDNLSMVRGNFDIEQMIFRLRQIQAHREARGYKTTFIIVSHSKKDADPKKFQEGDYRGSGLLESSANVTIALRPSGAPNRILMKVMSIRAAPKPEKCFLLERISEPGNHHFRFVDMVDEDQVRPTTSDGDSSTAEELKPYKPLPVAEKMKVATFIHDLHNEHPELSQAIIAKRVGQELGVSISQTKVGEILDPKKQ